MGKIIDLSKRADTSTLSKSDIAALEGDVGYYSRMLDDDWYEEYDQYFDISDVAEHHDALERAIDHVEHGSDETTKQALAFAAVQFKRNKTAMDLHTALEGEDAATANAGDAPKRDYNKIHSALIKVAETWSKTYKKAIPIFNYANAMITTHGLAEVAWA